MSNIDTRGRAVYSLAPKYLPAQQSAFSSAIGQMSQLVQRHAVDAQKESMAEAGRAANNDIINNTINPDRAMHEIAYSKSLAKGQALQSYGDEKTKISAGEYNEMDPEKYQAMLRDKHRGFTAGNAENPFASDMNAEYNDFWLKNEPALTAAQAGGWRVTMGAKQSEAMNKALREQAKIDAEKKKADTQAQGSDYSKKLSQEAGDGIDVQAFKDIIESPDYTLLDQNTRLMTALAAAGKVGGDTGDLTLLYFLRDEYGTDIAPGFRDTYQAFERKANRKQSAVTNKEALDVRDNLYKEVTAGTLSLDMYPQVENLKDSTGNAVISYQAFHDLYKQSQKNAIGNAAVRHQRDSFITGVPFEGTKQDMNLIADQEMERLYEVHNGDTELVLEQMGIYIAPQNKVWDKMQSLGTNFSKMRMMTSKGEINQQAVDTFKNLHAFKRGLNSTLNGDGVFAAHMSTESLAVFNEIDIMVNSTRGSIEDVWESISESRELVKTRDERLQAYDDLTTGEITKFTGVVETAFKAIDSSGDIFSVFRRAFNGEQDVRQAVGVASKSYNRARATGASEEAALRTATQEIGDAFKLFNGKMVYTGGVPLQELMGGEDPKHITKALVEDPEFSQELAKLFQKEGLFQKVNPFHKSDRRKLAITPDQVSDTKIKNESRRVTLDRTKMAEGTTIDFKNGLIVFTNPDSIDRRQFTIPLKVAGELSAAKRAKIEDLANIDRFYTAPFKDSNEGRKLLAGYADANAYFMKGIDKGIIETDITAEEYIELPPLEQTRKRLEHHEENYRGAMGVIKMTKDYFKMVRDVDTKSEDFLKVKGTPVTTLPEGSTVQITKGAGVKNNNPGTLRYAGQPGATGVPGKGFAKFKTPEDGFRALERQISLDTSRGKTLGAFISGYAPPVENETGNYIKFMEKELGVTRDTKLSDLNTYAVAKAVAKFESGTVIK